MNLVCGIYGYEMTRRFSACGMEFIPRYESYPDARAAARDLERYNLTAVVMADEFPGDVLFRLEAVLSFIEHLDVIVTAPDRLTAARPHDQFAEVLLNSRRHEGGGAMIGSDTFFGKSRQAFIEKAIQRLGDVSHCETTGYRTLFFKTTETFRQRKPFLEVSYFLLFSGLETYVRRTLDDSATQIAVLLTRYLHTLGFNVCRFSPNELERSMDIYASLRHVLFHHSKFEAHRKVAGRLLTFRLEDHFVHFLILVSLVVLKATDFDDGHINWNAWLDRQLFK